MKNDMPEEIWVALHGSGALLAREGMHPEREFDTPRTREPQAKYVRADLAEPVILDKAEREILREVHKASVKKVEPVIEDGLLDAVRGIEALIIDFKSADTKLEVLSKSPSGGASIRHFIKTKKLESMLETITHAIKSGDKVVEVPEVSIPDIYTNFIGGGIEPPDIVIKTIAALLAYLKDHCPNGIKIVDGAA